MFLVDPIGAIPVSSGSSDPSKDRPVAVRYLSKLEIRISLINTREFPEKAGRMYPPVIALEYGEVTLDDLSNGREVDFEFGVTYEMEIKESKKDIEVVLVLPSSSQVLDN
jgi:hypothetical protein